MTIESKPAVENNLGEDRVILLSAGHRHWLGDPRGPTRSCRARKENHRHVTAKRKAHRGVGWYNALVITRIST
jgi:hypothetical protein